MTLRHGPATRSWPPMTINRLRALRALPLLLLSAAVGAFGPADLAAASPPAARVDALGAAWSAGPYAYDGAGNIISSGPGEAYVYDRVGRLRSGTAGPDRLQEYTYDAYGNILSVTTDRDLASVLRPCVDAGTNRIGRAGADCNVRGSYDSAGNLTAYDLATFVYDPLDVVAESNVDGVRKIHLYSASDERIASIAVVDDKPSWSEWSVRDNHGRILRRFARNASGAWSWTEDYVYRGGALLAAEVSTAERTRQFFLDHLGTPRLITGSGGAEIGRHTYYPFGREVAAPAYEGERAKFTGHERDAANLDYMHARYSMPFIGRFLSVDPGKDWDPKRPQSWNLYAYVRNHPINATDPDGREIYFQVHPVAFDWYHTSIRIEPVDQKRYANDPDFRQYRNPSTNRSFMTLGAGSEGGKLVSNVNRTRDVDLSIKTTVVEIDLQGRDENQVIAALRAADSKYEDNLTYGAFPTPPATMQVFGRTVTLNGGTYNSNSYVAGLLQAVGLTPPKVPESTPGRDQPLLKKEFE